MNYFEKALSILDEIEKYGYESYIVGGAVRDYILKKELNDIDITTNMPLELIKKHFNVVENGILYDSLIIKDEYEFEITHYRIDVSYENHRHPIIKETNNIYDDLKRRDFTINSLIMDKSKNIIDVYNGIDDIKGKKIKAIGDAKIRFEEDALRILRALYFSSKLDFEIEDDTLSAMINEKKLLSSLSDERLIDYFYKIIYSSSKKGINYINKYDLFEFIPKYKKLLNLVDKFEKSDLKLAYYFIYNEYFSNEKELKRKINIISYLINNNFDNYSIYLYQNEIDDFIILFKALGYDELKIKNIKDNLALKNEKLALDKKEFALMFEGKTINYKIELVTKAILDKKIKNTKEDILEFLKR